MSTPTVTTVSPAREGPQGPTLAPGGGTPSSENRPWGPLKSFLAKTGLIDALRARGRGLSTAAHRSNTLEHQAKRPFDPTLNETRFRLFPGAQLGEQLGRNRGAIKLRDPLGGHRAPSAAAFGEPRAGGTGVGRSRLAQPCLPTCHLARIRRGGDER